MTTTSTLTLYRVWAADKRWTLVEAEKAADAMARVEGATRAEVAFDRQHPRRREGSA